MAKAQSKLDQFLSGHKWAARYARLSLPVLVRFVEQHRGRPDPEIPALTYEELAIEVGQPKHTRNTRHALGLLGSALKELEDEALGDLGRIPPIQLLVWSKGKEHPGELAFGFLEISKEDAHKLPAADRRELMQQVRRKILEYPKWRDILARLNLKPWKTNLFEPETIASASSGEYSGYGESEQHRRLKVYLSDHYEELGIKGQFSARFEERLLSGDIADLVLDEIHGDRRYAVEVKSHISNDSDIIRGIFQCVKYQAVLTAQEKYDSARASERIPYKINVILAVGRTISKGLQDLCELLKVRVVCVTVPTDYLPPG